MQTQSFKTTICTFLFFCFLSLTNLHADILLFQEGAHASYTISQELNASLNIFDEPLQFDSKTTLDLDVRIISVNDKNLSFPIELEVILKELKITGSDADADGSVPFTYSSTNAIDKNSSPFVAALTALIQNRTPLKFIVQEEQDNFIEKSGLFNNIADKRDTNEDDNIAQSINFTIELFLTQLFHLSGKNLVLDHDYPVSCYSLLNMSDDPLKKEEMKIAQNCNYSMQEIKDEAITGTWKGTTTAINIGGGFEGNVMVESHVSWDMTNTLRQKRSTETTIEEKYDGLFPIHAKTHIQQWCTPL